MKLIRSKVPVTIPHRSGTKQGIVAIYISEWRWEDRLNRYVAEVIDYEVTDVENTGPGMPLKHYRVISRETRIRTKAQIDQMFSYLAKDIVHTGSYTDQNTDARVNGSLLETQQNPIRDSNPEDWEIVDTALEIAPGDPEPNPEV